MLRFRSGILTHMLPIHTHLPPPQQSIVEPSAESLRFTSLVKPRRRKGIVVGPGAFVLVAHAACDLTSRSIDAFDPEGCIRRLFSLSE